MRVKFHRYLGSCSEKLKQLENIYSRLPEERREEYRQLVGEFANLATAAHKQHLTKGTLEDVEEFEGKLEELLKDLTPTPEEKIDD
jgi:hypothetical protein